MVRQDRWIIAASKHGWLNVFDIGQLSKPQAGTTPDLPALAEAADLRSRFGIQSPHDVDLIGRLAVVADPAGFGRTRQFGRIAVVRLFDDQGQLLPAERWTLAGVVESKDLVGANRVHLTRGFAYVGASTRARGGRFVVVDLRNPTAPQQLSSIPFAPDDGWGPNGLTVSGNVVFLAGGQSVEAIDVTDPSRPVLLARQRFQKELPNANPRYPGGGDSGHDLVYRDGYVFVTGQNDRCLLVLKVKSDRIRELARGNHVESASQ